MIIILHQIKSKWKKKSIKLGQIKYFGSLRYSKTWFKTTKSFYSDNLKKTKQIKIAFLKKFASKEKNQINRLIEILSSNRDYLVKARKTKR